MHSFKFGEMKLLEHLSSKSAKEQKSANFELICFAWQHCNVAFENSFFLEIGAVGLPINVGGRKDRYRPMEIAQSVNHFNANYQHLR